MPRVTREKRRHKSRPDYSDIVSRLNLRLRNHIDILITHLFYCTLKPRLCHVSRHHLGRDRLVATRFEVRIAGDDEKLYHVLSSRAFRAMLLERIER